MIFCPLNQVNIVLRATAIQSDLNEVECNFYTIVEEDSLEIYDAIFLIMIYGSM